MVYCPTLQMSADIFTKHFTDRIKWIHARNLIAHYLPEELGLGATSVEGRVVSHAICEKDGESRRPYNRSIIECCCSPDSKLGAKRPWSKDCLVIRISQALDATKQSTLEYILNIITTLDVPVLLFAAMPCAGGSPWQRLN